MSPEGPQSRIAEHQQLHISQTPATFYSKSPQFTMASTLHRPSLLQYASTPGLPNALHNPPAPALPAAMPGSSASFALVLGSPPNGFASPAFRTPSTTIKKRGRPFKNAQATPIQKIAKKKGRPFKTPEAAAAAAARASRGASPDQTPKKRGRPFKVPQDPEQLPAVIPPEPRFTPFICEWKNCPAELHNLDTLRAHLDNVHLRKQSSAGQLMCLWTKCCQEHISVDDSGRPEVTYKGVEFETKEEWQKHVKVAHLDFVARWQGDGPKTEMSHYKKSPPALQYTFRHGGPEGQVTPSVRNQPVEDGIAKINNRARFRKTKDGLYVVYEPLKDPELYMKVDNDQETGDRTVMDESKG